MVYEDIPKFDDTWFSRSNYEESDRPNRKVKAVFSFQKDIPETREIGKRLSDQEFGVVFLKQDEKKLIQSLAKDFDELIVIDVLAKDLKSFLSSNKKKVALLYLGGAENMDTRLVDFLDIYRTVAESSKFVTLEKPIGGGEWEKRDIASDRKTSAFQIAVDSNRLRTDKKYNTEAYELLMQIGYASESILKVVDETNHSTPNCEPE